MTTLNYDIDDPYAYEALDPEEQEEFVEAELEEYESLSNDATYYEDSYDHTVGPDMETWNPSDYVDDDPYAGQITPIAENLWEDGLVFNDVDALEDWLNEEEARDIENAKVGGYDPGDPEDDSIFAGIGKFLGENSKELLALLAQAGAAFLGAKKASQSVARTGGGGGAVSASTPGGQVGVLRRV